VTHLAIFAAAEVGIVAIMIARPGVGMFAALACAAPLQIIAHVAAIAAA
jgi:hypothetical protein